MRTKDDVLVELVVTSAQSSVYGIDLSALLAHLRIPPEFDDVAMSITAEEGCKVSMMVDERTANRIWTAYQTPRQYFCRGLAHDLVAVSAVWPRQSF